LRAEQDIRPDTWFFGGHFHEDPCMPGTLMFEGCCQAMQLFLLAGGHTLHRDGWRFRPVADETYKLRCRGQVIPTSRTLVYEIFVQEVIGGPRPTVRAQVACTIDGLRCFHADPFAIELVPDWPLERMEAPAADPSRPAFDYDSLLACAWGKPSRAFGSMYAPFDSERKVPRLPGPPYHFMTRVVSTEGTMGKPASGAACVVEYEVPPDAWYFRENGAPVMPLAVLMETALQPCGWLASWAGCALGTEQDFLFRNLDGTATQHVEVTPSTGTLITRARLDRVSRSGGMILVAFTVTMDARAKDGATVRVYDMRTGFGFFPPEAFANQVGVGSSPEERTKLAAPGEIARDLVASPVRGLAGGTLRMIDRLTDGGGEYWRAEKDIRASEWFFKAHFFQDPVQPGSLGIEAMVQLLQAAMAERGLLPEGHRFEGLALGVPLTWKYRGQVVPENRLVQTEVKVSKVDGALALADAALWVDGKKIYEARNLGMRVVPAAARSLPSTITLPVPVDHCPTWTIPAAPMTTLACTLLSATGARSLSSGEARRWLTFPSGPRSVEVRQVGERAEVIADGAVIFSAVPGARVEVPPVESLADARDVAEPGADLYASGVLFHGPSFHAVDRIIARGTNGATALLRGNLPLDVLLDGALHAVPHDAMHTWFPGVATDVAAYPARVVALVVAREAAVAGTLRAEVRALGLRSGRPAITAHVFDDSGTLVAFMELEEALLPKGPIGAAPPMSRRAFLLGQYVPGLALSAFDDDTATLSPADAARSDWLPGTLGRVYGESVSGAKDAPAIRAKELVASAESIHPRDIATSNDATLAWPRARPLYVTSLAHDGSMTRRVGARARCLDAVIPWWRARQGGGPWPGESIVEALVEQYVAEVEMLAPRDLAAVDGPVLFLANHETYIESALFTTILSALRGVPTRALAKAEHRAGWLGALHDLLTNYPDRSSEPIIAYFDQGSPAALPALLDVVSAESSLLIHVEGTRQVTSGAPVTTLSSAILDLAVRRGLAIVPVAFRGGVAGAKTDLPVAAQRHIVGRPILAEALAGERYADRRRIVLEAINALGSGVSVEGAGEVVASAASEIARVVDARRPGWSVGAEGGWLERWEEFARH
jgi:3-hydroxymyristoyl/3-hydroxydecanoyl-(acyl carrier protein) dehydratase